MDDLVALEAHLAELVANLDAMAAHYSENPKRCSRMNEARASAERTLELVRQQLKPQKAN